MRTIDGSCEIERVGAQSHCEGETRIVTTTYDDILHSGSLLPEVLLLPPPITGSSDDVAPSTTNFKVHEFTYYDQIWVYSALEAFKHGIYKEDFVLISNIQRLHKINALEKPKPIRLSLSNQIPTSEDEDSTTSDYDNPLAPKGDKVTRSFLPHGVSSNVELGDLITSINHLGAHIIDLNAVVSHVIDNFKDHITFTSASISSLLESQTTLSQRLTALEANQDSILENMNLFCEVTSARRINTDDVPKGEKRKRKSESRRMEDTESMRREESNTKASEDKFKRNATDEKQDGNDDEGDN